MTEGTKQSINTSAQRRGAVNVAPWDPFDPVANAVLDLIETRRTPSRAHLTPRPKHATTEPSPPWTRWKPRSTPAPMRS